MKNIANNHLPKRSALITPLIGALFEDLLSTVSIISWHSPTDTSYAHRSGILFHANVLLVLFFETYDC